MRRIAPLLAVLAVLLTALPATGAPVALPSTAIGLPHDDSSVLVRVSDTVDPAAVHALAGVGRVANRIEQLGVDVVTVPAGSVGRALAVYGALPGVEWAEPNFTLELFNSPDDPRYADQRALSRAIDAPGGWALYDPDAEWPSSGGATLAILDSGIDTLHSEFAGRIADCQSFLTGLGIQTPRCDETNVHGTHVAGIAAANTNNGIGIAGVAFDAELMVLRMCTYSCQSADAAAAIVYAADNGAHVTNMSFGGSGANNAQRAATEYAAEQGVVQVAASGNDGAGGLGTSPGVKYPAAFPDVIAVSATNVSGSSLASFSDVGPEVDVAAPGAGILSTGPLEQYLQLSGTSMASPHVAGLAALLSAMDLQPAEVRQALLDGAVLVDGASGKTEEYGHGLINVANSIQLALDILEKREAEAA